MKEIKVGDVFKYKHNGKHDDSEIVILYDKELNKRFLYNITYKVKIGYYHLLHAKFTGKRLTKKEMGVLI